jgi:hypothetical protein
MIRLLCVLLLFAIQFQNYGQPTLGINAGVTQSSLIRNFDDLAPATVTAPCFGIGSSLVQLGRWSIDIESMLLKKGGALGKGNSPEGIDKHHYQLKYLQNTISVSYQLQKHWFFRAGGYYAWLFDGLEKVNQKVLEAGSYLPLEAPLSCYEVDFDNMDFPRHDFGISLSTGFNGFHGVRVNMGYTISAPFVLKFSETSIDKAYFAAQTFYFTVGYTLFKAKNS